MRSGCCGLSHPYDNNYGHTVYRAGTSILQSAMYYYKIKYNTTHGTHKVGWWYYFSLWHQLWTHSEASGKRQVCTTLCCPVMAMPSLPRESHTCSIALPWSRSTHHMGWKWHFTKWQGTVHPMPLEERQSASMRVSQFNIPLYLVMAQ